MPLTLVGGGGLYPRSPHRAPSVMVCGCRTGSRRWQWRYNKVTRRSWVCYLSMIHAVQAEFNWRLCTSLPRRTMSKRLLCCFRTNAFSLSMTTRLRWVCHHCYQRCRRHRRRHHHHHHHHHHHLICQRHTDTYTVSDLHSRPFNHCKEYRMPLLVSSLTPNHVIIFPPSLHNSTGYLSTSALHTNCAF